MNGERLEIRTVPNRRELQQHAARPAESRRDPARIHLAERRAERRRVERDHPVHVVHPHGDRRQGRFTGVPADAAAHRRRRDDAGERRGPCQQEKPPCPHADLLWPAIVARAAAAQLPAHDAPANAAERHE
jgi:hypothetical protein